MSAVVATSHKGGFLLISPRMRHRQIIIPTECTTRRQSPPPRTVVHQPTRHHCLFLHSINIHSHSLGRKHQHSSSSSLGRKQAPLHEKEKLKDVPSDNNDDEFSPFDDQTASDIDDDSLETDKEEVQPDESVLHFYEELFCYDQIRLALNDFLERRKSK
jgi:hypothetical protein